MNRYDMLQMDADEKRREESAVSAPGGGSAEKIKLRITISVTESHVIEREFDKAEWLATPTDDLKRWVQSKIGDKPDAWRDGADIYLDSAEVDELQTIYPPNQAISIPCKKDQA